MITEKRLQFNSPWDNLAVFHAALGEKDKAVAELNKTYENRENFMVILKGNRASTRRATTRAFRIC